MEGKKTAGRQKIPMEKIENKVARYSSFSKRRLNLYKLAELSDTTKLVVTNVRNNVNETEYKLAEFKIREDVASKETIALDQAKEMREIGWWEDIEKLKIDELTQFEAWLNVADYNMKDRLQQLENEVASNAS
ncbi:agamous-like MADS-box protein AGL97 [Solanum tuberosum]|uniref:agamous-like MADS-box protein AGL97 n=1 Tax=Solanum tuberosum TaxID=4113 RepID=UPI0003D28BA9|nr:PREDICTED: agamous-like MADS-box protein AGL97 [Solanum tuberosum]